MATTNATPDPLAPAQVEAMTLQTDEAKATAAEIAAKNEAFEQAAQAAEAQAEVTAEQASQLDHVMEELLLGPGPAPDRNGAHGPLGDAVTGNRYSLRWNLLKVIGEYARHNGHADLIRERIDGATGE
jgi:hypothetical protein